MSGSRGVGRPRDEKDQFEYCPICDETFDARELGEVLDQLHGRDIEERPTQN